MGSATQESQKTQDPVARSAKARSATVPRTNIVPMSDPQTLIIAPMLGRPDSVAPFLASLEGTDGCRVVFVCSPGDNPTIEACRQSGSETIIHDRPQGPGDYASKINKAYRQSEEPLLFLGAGDLRFHPGWLTAARSKLVGRIGVVGTNDMGNPRVKAGQHSTHSLVTRLYADLGTIDGPGILHEGYEHNWCDNELVETARHRRSFVFAAASRVEHLHPAWGKGLNDPIYDLGRDGFQRDKLKFSTRRRLWSGR